MRPATLARVQQIGIDAYLDEQFAAQETSIPTPSGNSMGSLRQWVMHNYSAAPDQLRQRVAYALSQIIVTSNNKLVTQHVRRHKWRPLWKVKSV